MALDNRNVLHCGPGPGGGRQNNPFHASAGSSSNLQALKNVRPLGHIYGTGNHITGSQFMRRANWLESDIAGTQAATLIQATATTRRYLQLLTSASDNTGLQLQWTEDNGTTAVAGFIISTQYYGPYFSMTFNATSATTCGIFLGLAAVDTTVLDTNAALNVADAVGIFKAPGGTNLQTTCIASSSATTTTRDASFAVNTDYTIECAVQNASLVEFWINGTKYTTTTNIPTAALCPTLAIVTTTGAPVNDGLKVFRGFVGQELINADGTDV